MVSYQKGPTCHAYAWKIGPFWQDTIDIAFFLLYAVDSIAVLLEPYTSRAQTNTHRFYKPVLLIQLLTTYIFVSFYQAV